MLFKSTCPARRRGSINVTPSATLLSLVWQRNDVITISIRCCGGSPTPDRPEPMSGMVTGFPFEYSRIPFQTPAKQVQRSWTEAWPFRDNGSVCDKATNK